jgi:hypothetical protein
MLDLVAKEMPAEIDLAEKMSAMIGLHCKCCALRGMSAKERMYAK